MPKRKKTSRPGGTRRAFEERAAAPVAAVDGPHQGSNNNGKVDHDDGPVQQHRPLDDDNGKVLPLFPLRDTDRLYASLETVDCANKCVPCAYKIGLFDVALDTEFCRQVPNQRPEQCPRLRGPTGEGSSFSMGYQPGMSILTVGDGDFSFSLALARILFASSKKSRLVATSYETEETLRRVYPNFDETLKELHGLGATTLYQVDATRLEATLPSDHQSKFHRICWNFPCTAIAKGQDGQNQEMEDNKALVKQFVVSASPLLAAKGEIHICHKTKPPFNQWKLEQVALEASKNNKLEYAGRIVLDRAVILPYVPRKALDRKSFPCHDACIYIFQSQPTMSNDDNIISTIRTLCVTEDTLNASGNGIPKDPSLLQAVTPDLIQSIRSMHLNARGMPSRRSHINAKMAWHPQVEWKGDKRHNKRLKQVR